jgi:hypothetical protein
MPAGQTLEKRPPAALGLRFVRVEDRVLNPFFRNAATLDLKFGVLVVPDHRRPLTHSLRSRPLPGERSPDLSSDNFSERKCAFDIVVEKLALRAGVQKLGVDFERDIEIAIYLIVDDTKKRPDRSSGVPCAARRAARFKAISTF